MLFFDEATHTYKIDDTVLKSVSQLVASQFQPFNANAISASLEKHKSADPQSPYYGMTRSDILKSWNESGKHAREHGTRLHLHIEQFYMDGTIPQESPPEWEQFMKFVEDHGDWDIIGCEIRVHNRKVAGTIDAIFNTPKGVVLVDWKRCKAIDFSGYRNGIGYMKHLEDCNYNRYSLQLSLYRQLVAHPIVDAYIVQMHPDLSSYQKIKAQNFVSEAIALIN